MSNSNYKKISEKQHKVVFVVGPTASGKSDFALNLACSESGVIVNCDSVQVYQELEIGSAQPSTKDKSLCPHYLYSYVPFGHEMTAGQFVRDFFNLLSEMPPQQKIFVVGGTGFYFQALEKGMYPVRRVNIEIKNQIDQILQSPEGALQLYEELKSLDPETASKISINDHYRLGRAIELIRSEGKTVTEIKNKFIVEQNPFPFPLLKVGIHLKREELADRILMRSVKMIEKGLIDECRRLLNLLQESKSKFQPEFQSESKTESKSWWSPLGSVGYKETIQFILDQKTSSSELAEEIFRSTMKLAKKQKTWFQRDQDIDWIHVGDNEGEKKTVEGIKAFLKG